MRDREKYERAIGQLANQWLLFLIKYSVGVPTERVVIGVDSR